jgi:hypothetical protein
MNAAIAQQYVQPSRLDVQAGAPHIPMPGAVAIVLGAALAGYFGRRLRNPLA